MLHEKSVNELSQLLQKKQLSSQELTTHFLNRIAQYDKVLNSFITVTAESALQEAVKADACIAKNEATLLTGIPVAHKDLFCTKDVKTTCASKMLANFIAPYDATVVARCRQVGLVSLGKTNMDEFAMGASNETSFFGAVKNPWDIKAVPGGSSGGSAAALAARLTPLATGSDTGGSIRQPAAFCGLTGLKPTYGLVSRYGMIAFASSLDQGGPMARSAEDIALFLQAFAGLDERDATTSDRVVPHYFSTLNDSLQGIKIGLPAEYFGEGLHPAIAAHIETAIQQYEKMGAIIKKVHLSHTKIAIPTYYVIAPAEASSNLARFDGIRYGYHCDNPKDLNDLYSRTRQEGFGREVKRRIMIGTYVLSAGYYDAYYLKAQKIRRLIANEFDTLLKEVDVIAAPTTPTLAFNLNEKAQNPLSLYLADIYTCVANLAGIPAVSLPIGFHEQRPIGMQFIGPAFSEAKLLNLAHQYQRESDWHIRSPQLIES